MVRLNLSNGEIILRVYINKRTAQLTRLRDKKNVQVLWGDWINVDNPDEDKKVYFAAYPVWNDQTRKYDAERFSVPKGDCGNEPLLEMVFIDVGQGDGCIVSVPDSASSHKILVVDAGQYKNMHRFLNWRRRNFDTDGRLHAAIITHPDQDHYQGFSAIFDDKRLSFDHVYHNGLVERPGDTTDNIGVRKDGYCVEVIETRDQLEKLLPDAASAGKSQYARLMRKALARSPDVRMLGVDGLGPVPVADWQATWKVPSKLEVLGPIIERKGKQARLREFVRNKQFDKGKTKNGHSVILKLTYGKLRVVFGGDLNSQSEDFMLRHYGQIDGGTKLSAAVGNARSVLGADILKCCHHGSSDVTNEFPLAVNPVGFVVSSGDSESHVHPRPEILGLLGRSGRTERPMILCTEILRSTPETRGLTAVERKRLAALEKAVADAKTDKERKAALTKLDEFKVRIVNVYGAINIRTDGDNLLVAFLKEKSEPNKRWQTFRYVHDGMEWVPDPKDTTH